jgi:sugar lactone lactonase YvrE
MGKDETFQKPEVFLDGVGLVNGLAFSPDESILYFTETLSGVFSLDMVTRKKEQIFKPAGWLPVVDDLAVAPDGGVWVCYNSKEALLPIVNNRPTGVLQPVPGMGAPSSCRFGKGPGFRSDCLYVTEFGLKGRSLTKNGRGVWMFPASQVSR